MMESILYLSKQIHTRYWVFWLSPSLGFNAGYYTYIDFFMKLKQATNSCQWQKFSACFGKMVPFCLELWKAAIDQDKTGPPWSHTQDINFWAINLKFSSIQSTLLIDNIKMGICVFCGSLSELSSHISDDSVIPLLCTTARNYQRVVKDFLLWHWRVQGIHENDFAFNFNSL